MSYVTNIILTCSLSERDDGQAFKVLDSWLESRHHGHLTEVGHHSRGHKNMEALVLVGAFNGLELEDLLRAVRLAPWDDEECVRVFAQEQCDDWFRQVVPATPQPERFSDSKFVEEGLRRHGRPFIRALRALAEGRFKNDVHAEAEALLHKQSPADPRGSESNPGVTP